MDFLSDFSEGVQDFRVVVDPFGWVEASIAFVLLHKWSTVG